MMKKFATVFGIASLSALLGMFLFANPTITHLKQNEKSPKHTIGEDTVSQHLLSKIANDRMELPSRVDKRRESFDLAEKSQVAYIRGELIVKFKNSEIDLETLIQKTKSALPSFDISVKRELAPSRLYLLTLGSLPEGSHEKPFRGPSRTLKAARRLNGATFVEYAELNCIRNVCETLPNDTLYPEQGHYNLIDLPLAWDITTGSDSIIVGVIDSGGLSENAQRSPIDHPELRPNLLDGYDFISNLAVAGDGDGRDPDPADLTPEQHGIHVAGTIGAVTNNGLGPAGVCWNVKIVPARALGFGGGSDADILDALRWCAGLSVQGVPANANPAEIINMSLGGPTFSQATQDVITQLRQMGVLVIAAAGNNNTGQLFYPASYANVISVSAVDPDGEKASYSNFGTEIDITAPGGDQTKFGPNGGVISTIIDRKNNDQPTTTPYQGTSMASPHVAGVAALMLAANPSLTPTQLESMIQSTATDLGSPGRDDFFGNGLINAFKAVEAASGTPLFSTPFLDLTPNKLSFQSGQSTKNVFLQNYGTGTINVTSVIIDTQGTGNWLSATPTSGSLPQSIAVTVDPSILANGSYEGVITINSSAGSKDLSVSLVKENAPNVGTITVQLVDVTGVVVSETLATSANNYSYSFSGVPSGSYTIRALTDNNSDMIASRVDEFTGAFPTLVEQTPVTFAPGQVQTGFDFSVTRVGDLVKDPGVGLGPIAGALFVRVLDSTTRDGVSNASVFIDDGTLLSAVTDDDGRAILTGSINGPQTITVTAQGFSTATFVDLNAQYATFLLSPTTELDFVSLDVTVSGLNPGQDSTGIISVTSGGTSRFSVLDTSETVRLEIPRFQNVTVSALIFDGNDQIIKGSFTSKAVNNFNNRVESLTATPSNITMTKTISGTITAPTAGNFGTALGFSEIVALFSGQSSPVFATAVQQSASPAMYSLSRTEFPTAIESRGLGLLLLLAIGDRGQSTGKLLVDRLAQLPTSFNAQLLDTPGLQLPNAFSNQMSTTPTFNFTATPTTSFSNLKVVSPCGDYSWSITLPSSRGSFTLPNIPTGGLIFNRPYTWNLTNAKISSFDFNNFAFDELLKRATDLTTSESREFVVSTSANSWGSQSALPDFREGTAAATQVSKTRCRTLVCGGTDSTGTVRDSVFEFDIDTNSWITQAAMLRPRQGHAIGFIEGKYFIAGGLTDTGATDGFVHVFDPELNSWSAGTGIPAMPTPRSFAAYTVAQDLLFVVGGTDSTGTVSNTVEAYSPDLNTWITITALPQPRQFASAAVFGRKLYVVGGIDSSGTVRPETFIYDLNSLQWSTGIALPAARAGHGVVPAFGGIYVVGGIDGAGTEVADVFKLNLNTNVWSQKSSIPQARSSLSVVNTRSQILAVGGGTSTSIFNSADLYIPD